MDSGWIRGGGTAGGFPEDDGVSRFSLLEVAAHTLEAVTRLLHDPPDHAAIVVAPAHDVIQGRIAAGLARQKLTFIPISTLRGFWTLVAVLKNGDVEMPLKPPRFARFVRLFTAAKRLIR